MKNIYDGFQVTDKLAKAMDDFEKNHPNDNIFVLALEYFLQNKGLYDAKFDDENYKSYYNR